MLIKDGFAERTFDKYQKNKDHDRHIDRTELKKIRRSYAISLIFSGLIGAVFVILFYLPIHYFQDFFHQHVIEISLWDFSFDLYWLKELDNILLTISEIVLLGILNVHMINKLAGYLDFPPNGSAQFDLHRSNIIRISLDKKQKGEKDLGLNPFAGMSKMRLFIFLLIVKIKATLSNFLIKFLLQRFASRYLLKIFIDLAGTPVYAFWNAYATSFLFKKAKYYIFSVEITEAITRKIQESSDQKELLRKSLDGLLAYVVALKRDFSEINYFFSSQLIDAAEMEFTNEEKKLLDLNTIQKELKHSETETLMLVFVTGLILDGSISRREKKHIKRLISDYRFESKIILNINNYLKEYKQGNGVNYLKSLGYL